MLHLSKSKYCAFWQCPKIAWLAKYKPELNRFDSSTLTRMDEGNELGDLAMGLFGDYVEVTVFDGDKIDLGAMIRRTKDEIEKGTPVICEASFNIDGLYCAVDILKREQDGWAIYEVKSSTHSDKAVYAADVAYQKHVLERCGIKVTGTYLVCINSNYVFNGTLNINELLCINEISAAVESEQERVPALLEDAKAVLLCDSEPLLDLDLRCNDPYPCQYWDYCAAHLPQPSVFDLYRLPYSKKMGFYKNGIISYRDLQEKGKLKNKTQLRQIDFALYDRPTHIDRDEIAKFLGTLSYPLYFLDFETMQPLIPRYIGTKPYAQVPFQYSLHYIEEEGGTLEHKEFLAESGTDPRRTLAEQLCRDIPMNVCVTAYNKGFECTRIKELAALFPDLSEHLLNIESNICDLLTPFQSGHYYNRRMGGSFSIKSVLPALFPDDPALDYHNLEGVHNGSEAMNLFPQIALMPPEEQRMARQQLLKYCELDTYAMVKVWQALTSAVSDTP